MNYLVTGGAGFIGSHIVERLVDCGDNVIVLDNFSTGTMNNLIGFEDKVRVLEGDICQLYDNFKYLVKSIDYVIHLAAMPSIKRSLDEPVNINDVNVGGTVRLLDYLFRNNIKIKRFVFISSSSVYGGGFDKHLLSPYAVSKSACENYCKVFHEIFRFPAVVLRLFNVFGPKQSPETAYAAVIPRFIKAMIQEIRPVVFGDGLQTRDFTYIKNVVNAVVLACETKNIEGQIFDVGCGESHNVISIISHINDILGTNVKPLFNKERPGDLRNSLANIQPICDIGYRPEIFFKDGIKKTVEFFIK